MQRVMC